MANSPNSQPWWHRSNKETLGDRVKQVQSVNDPTIIADDVQRYSKIALYALLAFTTLLSGFSYFKFFEKSFGFHLALVMALLLACIIEFGKNWGFLKVLRIPFFQGWSFVWREVSNTVMWVFLLFLSVVTFAASVYNSTQGAHQLSLLLSHERTYQAFQPNTSILDAQIASLSQKDKELGSLKMKNGKTNWAVQPLKAENAKNLASLQEQRRVSIEKQRADWESKRDIQEGQNQFSANSLLAVGGWVELLQFLLMFVRAAAERSLDKTASERTFRQPSPLPSHHHPPNGAPIQNQTAQRYYFNRASPTGNVEAALEQQPLFYDTPQKPVSQSPQPVTQIKAAQSGELADDVLRLALTRLQGHAANFDRKHGRNETTAQSIHAILESTLEKMRGSFHPSEQVHARFSAYIMDTLFPMLMQKGYPYPKVIQFIGWLRTIAPTFP